MDPLEVLCSETIVGKGAFSVVFKGVLIKNNMEVAVKELKLEEWGRCFFAESERGD